MTAKKGVLRYLKGTSHYTLKILTGTDDHLNSYIDANWINEGELES